MLENTVADHSGGVVALLKIIADPKKHQKALEELQARADAAQKMFADVQAAQRQVDQQKAEIDGLRQAAKDLLAQAESDANAKNAEWMERRAASEKQAQALESTKRSLDVRANLIEQQSQELSERARAQAAQERDLQDRSNACERRRKELDTREAAIADSERRVAELKCAYEAKLAAPAAPAAKA